MSVKETNVPNLKIKCWTILGYIYLGNNTRYLENPEEKKVYAI
jgi:hypothetical protein